MSSRSTMAWFSARQICAVPGEAGRFAEAGFNHVGQGHHASQAVGIRLDMGNEGDLLEVDQTRQEAIRTASHDLVDSPRGTLSGHGIIFSERSLQPSNCTLVH